jgi:uncharacterized protein YpmB
MIVNVIIGIIILHLIAGFGFMLWKLMGPVKEPDQAEQSSRKENE